jgi:hypothetical protein
MRGMESSRGFGGHADAKRNRRSNITFNIVIIRSAWPLINTLPLLTLRASQAKMTEPSWLEYTGGSNRFSRKAVTQPRRN